MNSYMKSRNYKRLIVAVLVTLSVFGARIVPGAEADSVLEILFCDNMESGTGNWTLEYPWGLTTSDYNSPNHSLTDSPSGNYSNNRNISATLIPEIDLSNCKSAVLEFQTKYFTESCCDRCYVEISVDGGSWQYIPPILYGTQSTWVPESYSLNSYVGHSIRVRFRLYTDGSVTYDGWYIDDVCVRGEPNEVPPPPPPPYNPNPANGAVLVDVNTLLSWNNPLLGKTETAAGVNSNMPVDASQDTRLSYEAPHAIANVAIFQDSNPWGSNKNQQVLIANGISYTIYGSSAMGAVDLSIYDKAIISSVQRSSFYTQLQANIGWFESYVAAGGILDIHAATFGEQPLLPGGFRIVNNPSDAVTIVDTDHPVVTIPHIITDAELDGWNFSVHGYISVVPAGAQEILEVTASGLPCAMELNFGLGRIFVTNQTVEWTRASYNYLENTILYGTTGDGITYDVYFDTANPPVTLIRSGLTATHCKPVPYPLADETTYYWQVIASNAGGQTAGPVWSFATIGPPGEIEVTDSIAPPDDLNMPFGDVIVGLSRTEQITIINTDPTHELIVTDISLGSVRPTWGTSDLSISLPAISGGSQGSDESYLPAGWVSPEQPESKHVIPGGYKVLDRKVDVLLLASGADPTMLRTGLAAFPDINSVGYFNANSAVPTLAQLNAYGVVVVMSNGPFTNATQTGNVLADYVDGGGKVIEAVASFGTGGGWELAGRFVTGDYEPFGHGPGEFIAHSLGNFDSTHPIMAGITTLTDSLPAGVTLKPQAIWVANWNNGRPLVATRNENVVGINIFAFDTGSWTGNVVLLFHNAAVWLVGQGSAGFTLTNVPLLPATIPPGDNITFNVIFEPTKLKEYNSSVTIKSNDSNESEVNVLLSGTGIPDYLDISPVNDVEFSGHPGGPFVPSNRYYQLTNNCPVSIDWTAEPNCPWLDIWPTSGRIPDGNTIIVTVAPNAYADTLPEGDHPCEVVFTDVTTTIEQTRNVTLNVYTEPKMWANPLSIDVNIPQGGTETRILTIGNTGGSTLEFTLSDYQTGFTPPVVEDQSISSVPPGYDFKVLAKDAAFAPGQLLVRFAPQADRTWPGLPAKNSILAKAGNGKLVAARIKKEYKIVRGLSLVKLPDNVAVKDAIVMLNNTPGILYAEPDYQVKALSAGQTIPNDPRFSELWGLNNTGQSGGTPDADIDAPEAWDISTDGSNIIVAVIDTGVDYTHPDLAANMWVNAAEANGLPGFDDDGNGYIDDIYGYDFVNNDGNPWDDHYHGTHCAGTIGAVGNNGVGVTGVCWNVKIMALKFLDSSGRGYDSDAIECIQYAILMGANLSSNSWGTPPEIRPGQYYNQALKDAIDAAGNANQLFIAAAGNDYGNNNDVRRVYPASYDGQNIIAVLATDKYDNMSSFSNYGPTSVDIGAPGSDILSCQPGSNYQYLSGTSMATPHVAGACALVWSMCTSLTNLQVKDIILRTVDQIPALNGLCVSEGRLNLYEAILEAQASCGPLSSPWLKFVPDSGSVAPGDAIDVNVIFDGNCYAGTYKGWIDVNSNDPYQGSLPIIVTMTVEPIDYFTELFDPNYLDPNDPNYNDIANRTLTFRLDDTSGSYYKLCSNEAADFPVDPNGGTILSLGDDDYIAVDLNDAYINFYGESYSIFYIGSNGYISFTSGDIRHAESLLDHFDLPRISALFDDLDPSTGGTISWKQLDDRVVVTFENVPEYGLSNSNSFQIEMCFNGKIRITLLDIAADDGLVGLSEGDGLPAYFTESDLSEYDLCTFLGDLNGDLDVDLVDFAIFAPCWQTQNMDAKTVRDEFNSVSYSGNNGTQNWSNSWQEAGEADGPSSGFLQVISDGTMRIGDRNGKNQLIRSLTREADLSGATTATLTYDYVVGNIGSDGYVSIQVSGNGGLNWDTLAVYLYDDVSGSESFDITSHVSSNTQIRFAVGSERKIKMYLYVDNVQIEYDDTERPWYPWCNGSDFNRDFRVDFKDLLIFADHWLE